MGYTHYWRDMPTEHSEARWEMFVEAVEHVYEELPEFADGYFEGEPLIIRNWEGKDEPEFSLEGIYFNGDDSKGLDHESFVIERVPSRPDFSFCKTARKPYDLLVCSTLLLYKHFWPEVQISSDGNFEDWESAIEHVKNVTGLHIDIFNNIDQIEELV